VKEHDRPIVEAKCFMVKQKAKSSQKRYGEGFETKDWVPRLMQECRFSK